MTPDEIAAARKLAQHCKAGDWDRKALSNWIERLCYEVERLQYDLFTRDASDPIPEDEP